MKCCGIVHAFPKDNSERYRQRQYHFNVIIQCWIHPCVFIYSVILTSKKDRQETKRGRADKRKKTLRILR